MKRFAVACVLSVLVLGFPVPQDSQGGGFMAWDDWMTGGTYVNYTTVQTISGSNITTMFNYSLQITTVASTRMFVLENYTAPGTNLSSIVFGDSFRLDSRQSDNRTGYCSWLWVNPGDYTNGTVYVGGRVATVIAMSQTTAVLEINETSGNHSIMHFELATNLLKETTGYWFLNGTKAYSNTTRVSIQQGRGPGKGQEGGPRVSNPVGTRSEGGGPSPLSDDYVYPPYTSGDEGYVSTWGSGMHGEGMDTDYDEDDGWLNAHDGYAWALGHNSRSWASGRPFLSYYYYTPPETSLYRVYFHFTMSGTISWLFTGCEWFGCPGLARYVSVTATVERRGANQGSRQMVLLDQTCTGGYFDCWPVIAGWSDDEFETDYMQWYLQTWHEFYFRFELDVRFFVWTIGFAYGYIFGGATAYWDDVYMEDIWD